MTKVTGHATTLPMRKRMPMNSGAAPLFVAFIVGAVVGAGEILGSLLAGSVAGELIDTPQNCAGSHHPIEQGSQTAF
jgi:hypothetical protein